MIKAEFGRVTFGVTKESKTLQEAELFADMTCIIVGLQEYLGTDATLRVLEEAIHTTFGESEDKE